MQWNHNLARALVERDWLGEDALKAFARAQPLPAGKFQVPGLDEHGAVLPDAVVSSDDNAQKALVRRGVAVSAAQPDALAVAFYQALMRAEAAWIVLTPTRLAVVSIRDSKARHEGEVSNAAHKLVKQRTMSGMFRGVGEFMRKVASELQQEIARPPLHERPEDAVLIVEFETPRSAVVGVEAVRHFLVGASSKPVQLDFIDQSWVHLLTDEDGVEVLTLPY